MHLLFGVIVEPAFIDFDSVNTFCFCVCEAFTDKIDSSKGLFYWLVADLGIKVLLFQISLLMSPITFPICFLHYSLLLILNPIGTLRNVRHGVMEKLLWISKGSLERISTNLYGELKSKKKLATRMAWGIFWSFYVLIVLLGLLVMAFIAGSVIMQKVVEEPVMVKKNFKF